MLTHATVESIANTLTPVGNFLTVESEPSFAKKVRLASVLLKANTPISYNDIRTMTYGVYHKIQLRIASARFTNNKLNFQWSEDDIVAMLTPNGLAATTSPISRLGAFSGGIEFAAAQISAAHLIRNIPLNTALKFNDMADALEKSAWEDIERIIQIIGSSAGSSTNNTEEDEKKGQAFLYIAHSLNLTTIPDTIFNTPDKNSNPATYLGNIDLDDPAINPPIEVEVVNTLSVPTNYVGICYFYMTGQSFTADQDIINTRAYSALEGAPQNSKSVSYKIEKAFKIIGEGDTNNPNDPATDTIVNIDDIITVIADEINSETLAITGSNVANILTAPQRGNNITTVQTVSKRELYPLSTTLKNRKASFSLYHRINKLSFDVRRYSNKSETEMLTIGFYTVPLASWQSYKQQFDNNPLSVNPRTLRNSGTLGIEGLVFGSDNTYNSLNNKVPYSALLNVDKGNVTAISVAPDAGGGLNPTNNLANSDASNVIDTLYFAYDNPLITTPTINPFNSNLILRLTSTSYLQSTPVDIEIDLTTEPFINPYSSLNINPFVELSIGEQIAGRIVDSIFNYTRQSNLINSKDSSNVLGVLLGDYQRITTIINSTLGTASEIPLETFIDPISSTDTQTNFTSVQELTSTFKDSIAGRVQIVAFRYREEEYRIVLEIVSIPNNLWIGTGNYILRRTQWALGRRRSITIETKALNNTTTVETKSEELSSVTASVSKVEASKSKLLQSVFDKRNLLEDAKKGFVNKWQYPT